LGAVAGLAKWGNPSGPPVDWVWPALDGAKTSAASALWGTSRPPRQTQLMESARLEAGEVPEPRRRSDNARSSPLDDAHKARALYADGGAEGPDSGGLDDKTEAGAGAGDEARRREDAELIS
jgi:hypothetical protein